MSHERDIAPTLPRSAVERLLAKTLEEDVVGRPLSRRARHTRRSVEAYLKSGVRPRWMERIAEIERGIAAERRRVGDAYRTLQAECGPDRALFARRWRTLAQGFRFDAVNELIRQHNDWYPIERDLPMDPRTRDYVPIHGRSYRKTPLGPDWVIEHFPPPR